MTVYLIVGLSFVAAIVDQLTKLIVVSNLKPVSEVVLIPGLLSFSYVENKGAAFGILSDARWVFILFTIIIIIALLFFIVKKNISSKLFITSAVLIIGGGIGNLYDRILLGYVVDFIKVSFFPPVFNFADCCVTVGAALMVVYLLFFSDINEGKKTNDKP